MLNKPYVPVLCHLTLFFLAIVKQLCFLLFKTFEYQKAVPKSDHLNLPFPGGWKLFSVEEFYFKFSVVMATERVEGGNFSVL